MKHGITVTLTCLLAGGIALAQGRGDYLNVESPQVHPIDIAYVDGEPFLLVVNTPDNSVEIYDTDDASTFIARVPVGLEPVSVRYVPEIGRFYAVNFLGDSLTSVSLAPGTGGNPLNFKVNTTQFIGEEPMDVTYYPLAVEGQTEPIATLFVAFLNFDGVGWFDASTLQPVTTGTELFEAAIERDADSDCDGIPDIKVRQTLKAPRTLLIHDGDLLTLSTRVDIDPPDDMGANCRDPRTILSGNLTTSSGVSGLGSTNYNMARASNGDIFVVGGDAQNHLDDEPTVAAAETGFVESMFYMVRDICGTPTIKARDVNLQKQALQLPLLVHQADSGQGAVEELIVQPVTGPVPFNKALAQLTDVVPFEENGEVVKVFFTAMGSDRLGIIEPDFNQNPINWPIRRRNIAALQHPVAGPRGLALKAAPGDPRPRLYVANRLDNSVIVYDPISESKVHQFTLQQDPTPSWIRSGQEFLYSAKLSGTGFVSCASCHVDGRTDDLPWDLGDPNPNNTAPIPATLVDGDAVNQLTDFDADKDDMITQSLQGLLNWEVDPETMKLVTNAPYHWRGDRQDFVAFNPAFEDLMLGSKLDPLEMDAFEEFNNSIHYGPNPKQPRNRVYSGDFGDPSLGVDNSDGSTGALRGLKIFHTVRALGQSSCVRCHQLPEGSNNRITVNLGQPTESAALRGLFQKEGKRDIDGYSTPDETAYTGFFGMLSTGSRGPIQCPDPLRPHVVNIDATINSFINFSFPNSICGSAGSTPFCANGQDLSQYVHELDWGTGPLVGYPLTVNLASVAGADDGVPSACNPAAGTADEILDCMEDQSRLANSGVAASGILAALQRGFWFDPRIDQYVEEPAGAVLGRGALLSLIGDRDYLTFTATPLGSERRVAAPDGRPFVSTTPGTAPAALELLPMAPNTANTDIPTQTEKWANLNNTNQESIFVHTLRIYQDVLAQTAPQFGLPQVRHDAPRRFRVAGHDIRPGAELHLFTFDWPDGQPMVLPLPTIDPNGPLNQVPTRRSTFPLYPTDETTLEGKQIWETAVELDTLAYTMLMLGWEDAPGVQQIFNDVWVEPTGFAFPDPPDAPTLALFNAVGYNLHYVRVVNEDTSQGDASTWLPIILQ